MKDLDSKFSEGGEKAKEVIDFTLSEDCGLLTAVSRILFWVLFGKVKVEEGQVKIDAEDKLDLKREENRLLGALAIEKGREILVKCKRSL